MAILTIGQESSLVLPPNIKAHYYYIPLAKPIKIQAPKIMVIHLDTPF